MNNALTKSEKKNLLKSITKGASISLLDLYKAHYTRFGTKKSFFFALRRTNLIAETVGKMNKPTVRTASFLVWNDATNSYRLPLNMREQFGDSFKDEIRQVMMCLETHKEEYVIERNNRFDKLLAAGFKKTESSKMVEVKFKEQIKNLYNLDKSPCQGEVNEDNENRIGEDEKYL